MSKLMFVLGVVFGLIASMMVNEVRGQLVRSGTMVYPNLQSCILKTSSMCEFTSIGVYITKAPEGAME